MDGVELGEGREPSHYVVNPNDFKRWRQFALLKQGVLAEQLGVCQSLVSRYEQSHLPVQKAKMEVIVKEINDALRRGGVRAECRIEDLTSKEIYK